jgi:hypothetical protein
MLYLDTECCGDWDFHCCDVCFADSNTDLKHMATSSRDDITFPILETIMIESLSTAATMPWISCGEIEIEGWALFVNLYDMSLTSRRRVTAWISSFRRHVDYPHLAGC